ncbi:membrane protein [Microbacterium phage Huwbert]|nr:membrane protein [Microbacterium phage Huwbert]
MDLEVMLLFAILASCLGVALGVISLILLIRETRLRKYGDLMLATLINGSHTDRETDNG